MEDRPRGGGFRPRGGSVGRGGPPRGRGSFKGGMRGNGGHGIMRSGPPRGGPPRGMGMNRGGPPDRGGFGPRSMGPPGPPGPPRQGDFGRGGGDRGSFRGRGRGGFEPRGRNPMDGRGRGRGFDARSRGGGFDGPPRGGGSFEPRGRGGGSFEGRGRGQGGQGSFGGRGRGFVPSGRGAPTKRGQPADDMVAKRGRYDGSHGSNGYSGPTSYPNRGFEGSAPALVSPGNTYGSTPPNQNYNNHQAYNNNGTGNVYPTQSYGAPEPVPAAGTGGYGAGTAVGYNAAPTGYGEDYSSQNYSTAPPDNRGGYGAPQTYTPAETYPGYNKPAGIPPDGGVGSVPPMQNDYSQGYNATSQGTGYSAPAPSYGDRGGYSATGGYDSQNYNAGNTYNKPAYGGSSASYGQNRDFGNQPQRRY